MALSRDRALFIRNVLDNWLPPVVRDSRWLMYPLLRLAFGRRYRVFADFKPRAFSMTARQFSDVYSATTDLQRCQGSTDLNDKCVEAILRGIRGSSVLDAGAGRGFLAERLASLGGRVAACDIVRDSDFPQGKGMGYTRASLEHLPFADNSFDTVVTTHTLEHVQRIDLALAELRRVAARRLIVVVPRERPYRFSFNLHIHFFPYAWNWQAVAGHQPNSSLIDLDDWFYVEDLD